MYLDIIRGRQQGQLSVYNQSISQLRKEWSEGEAKVDGAQACRRTDVGGEFPVESRGAFYSVGLHVNIAPVGFSSPFASGFISLPCLLGSVYS